VVTILGLLGGVIAGFSVLKDRVRVVVQSDEADMGPDPTALLRDDVLMLTSKLEGLQGAIVENFGNLADGLEGRAQERHNDVLALRREVAELTADLRNAKQQLAAMDTRVAELQRQGLAAHAAAAAPVAADAGAGDAGAGDAQPATSEPEAQPQPIVAEPVTPQPVADVSESQPQPATEEPATEAPAKKKTGFLSFSLPKQTTAFDQPQVYKLLPQLCRVGFDAKSTLHDFTGVTSAVTGSFRADFDDPQGLCEGEVIANATTLKTGVEGRDTNMYEHLDTESHRDIRFQVERFVASEGGVDVKARTAKGEVVGKMTIRGKTRELRMPVEIQIDPQQRLVVEGQASLDLEDYEVPVPSQLGMINMEKDVVVWIALRARSQGDKQ